MYKKCIFIIQVFETFFLVTARIRVEVYTFYWKRNLRRRKGIQGFVDGQKWAYLLVFIVSIS